MTNDEALKKRVLRALAKLSQGPCAVCGAIGPTRPYGPYGADLCIGCVTSDREAASERGLQVVREIVTKLQATDKLVKDLRDLADDMERVAEFLDRQFGPSPIKEYQMDGTEPTLLRAAAKEIYLANLPSYPSERNNPHA